MKTFGRYQLVREYWCPTGALSEPYVLDRGKMRLSPYRGIGDAREEWERVTSAASHRADMQLSLERWRREIADAPTRLQRQRKADELQRRDSFASLAALFTQADLYGMHLLYSLPISTITTIALSSNYVAGTSGSVAGVRYQATTTRTLNSVYFFITSLTGTAANVNDINLEVRAEASAGALTPNTGATVEVKTKDPASATGWIASTGWTASLAALSRYFICVGDADGNGTDFATVNARIIYQDLDSSGPVYRFGGMSSTNGWVSGNTASSSAAGAFVLAFADGTSLGNPLSTTTTPSTSTHQRGLRITTSGLIANLPIYGMTWGTGGSASTALTGMKIFTGTTAPNGSADHTSTSLIYNTTAAQSQGCFTSTGAVYTLTAGTAYSIVTTYGSTATTGPRRADIGTGEDATLRKAMPGAGEFYYREDDGGSTWGGDLVGSVPTMGLLVDGQVAASAGGGVLIGSLSGGIYQ